MQLKLSSALGVVLTCCSLALCGGCAPAPVAISGQVTLDGRPLDEAALQFVPDEVGQRLTACEVHAGRYELPAEIGLLPGNYRIDVVDLPPLTHSDAPRRPFPARYAQQSPLRISIETNGPRTFDFALSSAP